jgi:hypothetical protein
VFVFWDIQPAEKEVGWIIPKQAKTAAIAKPVHDTRARIKRRQFEWET